MRFRLRAAFFLIFLFSFSSAFAQGFDHSALNRFLKQYVDASGHVNYAAAKQNSADLDQYLALVKQIDRKALQNTPQQERLAFWLNVYHAGLLALILENYPIKSTQEIPSFWDRRFLQVGLIKKGSDAGLYGLSEIRSNILVSQFQDEKIHFALAIGAKGGPLFPREIFTGPRVRGQLYQCVRREVNRPAMVNVDPAQGLVNVSLIFQWYSPDLLLHFGKPERRGKLSRTDTAIVNFLIRYLKKIEKIKFLKAAQYKIGYTTFDWSLNDTVMVPADEKKV